MAVSYKQCNCGSLETLNLIDVGSLKPMFCAQEYSTTPVVHLKSTMAGSTPSLLRVHDLLRDLRQGIRRIEVVEGGTRRDDKDDSWTPSAVEVSHEKTEYTLPLKCPELDAFVPSCTPCAPFFACSPCMSVLAFNAQNCTSAL